MPIDYRRYPPDWEERRARILERDGYRCKFCHVPQYAVGYRDHRKRFIPILPPGGSRAGKSSILLAGMGMTPEGERISFRLARQIAETQSGEERYIVIVLTVAHLDHDERNWKVSDERLASLCQHCHLIYDAPEKARRRAEKQPQKRVLG